MTLILWAWCRVCGCKRSVDYLERCEVCGRRV
jgi:hypothetical protein